MKNQHFAFLLTLLLLFIAPRLPIGTKIPAIPLKSTLSLGFLGFIIWILIKPTYLLKLPRCTMKWSSVFFLFALYSVVISVMSLKIFSLFYAIQYFIYIYFSIFILGNYLVCAEISNELKKTFNILIFVAIIYVVGCLISLLIGPIYPTQVGDVGRLWGGEFIRQGVGFGVSQNSVGGILIFFIGVALFCFETSLLLQFLVIILFLFALITTISRSAILSFMVASICILFPIFVRCLSGSKINRSYLHIFIGLICGCLLIVIIISMLFPNSFRIVLTHGFGWGDSSNLKNVIMHENNRINMWLYGFHSWANSSTMGIFLGKGFKNSSILETSFWITAHNFYINVLGDFGLIGLCIFLITVLRPYLLSIKLGLANNKYGMFGIFVISGLLVHNMTETFLYGIEYIFILIFTVHILYIMRNRYTYKIKSSAQPCKWNW